MTNEIWKHHPDYPYHEFSSEGRVRVVTRVNTHSHYAGSFIRGSVNAKGYIEVRLKTRDGKSPLRRLHRIILETFKGPCPEGYEGAHNDGVPSNNELSNLDWKTPKDNQADRVIHGTHNRGKQNPAYVDGLYMKSEACE